MESPRPDETLRVSSNGSSRRRSRSFLALAACGVTGGIALLQPTAWAQVADSTKNGTQPVAITVTPSESAVDLAKAMGVPVAAAQQVLSLDADKETWTPAQQKIASDFIYLARMAAGKEAAPGVAKLATVAQPDANGFVKAILLTKFAPTGQTAKFGISESAVLTNGMTAIVDAITAVGGEVINSTGNEIVVNVPVSQIEALASRSDVVTIRPFLAPHHVGRVLGSSVAGHTPSPWVPYLRKRRTPAEMRTAVAAALTRAGIPFDTFSLSNLLLNATDYNGTNTGVIGEGVATHAVASAYSLYGVSGMNSALGRRIRIGVQSDGDKNLAASQTSSDLPPTDSSTYGTGTTASVTVAVDDTYTTTGKTATSKTLDGPTGNTGEGTAMMQIVHDMVPDAKIFFASADYSEAQFAKNILLLRFKYKCDIVCDDVGYYDEPVFSDGQVAQAVNQLTSNGGFYFSSAGNEGHHSAYSQPNGSGGETGAETSSTWEGDFVSGGAVTKLGSKTVSGSLNAFASGVNYNTVTYPEGTSAFLMWSDPASGSSNDYDLYCLTSAGAFYSAGTTAQTGTQLPYETCSIVGGGKGYQLYILKKTAAATRALHLTTYGEYYSDTPALTYNTTGCTFGHNSAADGFGVAATPATTNATYGATGPYPNAFNSTDQSEYFSSDGPRTVFYTVTGGPSIPVAKSPTGYTLPISTPTYTLIGSAPTFAVGGSVRKQPFITAADGVSSSAAFKSTTGLNPFYGTSAAAPHAASIAALLMSYSSSAISGVPGLTVNGGLLSQADMHTVLSSSAIDIEAAGYDATTGYGIVMPAPAIAFLSSFIAPSSIFATPSTTTATINWNTNLPANSTVTYGTSAASLTSTASSSAAVTAHQITLTGLTAGVTYYYKVASATATGSASYTDPTARTFTTSGSKAASLALTGVVLATKGDATVATLTIANNGGDTSPVMIQSVQIAAANAVGAMPSTVGALAAGESKTSLQKFAAVASGRTFIVVTVTDGAGVVYTFSQRVTAP